MLRWEQMPPQIPRGPFKDIIPFRAPHYNNQQFQRRRGKPSKGSAVDGVLSPNVYDDDPSSYSRPLRT